MNPDRGSVNWLAVRAQYSEIEGTAPHTALYDGKCFAGRWRLSFRKKRERDDDDGAQNTNHSVHMLAIIRAEGEKAARRAVLQMRLMEAARFAC